MMGMGKKERHRTEKEVVLLYVVPIFLGIPETER